MYLIPEKLDNPQLSIEKIHGVLFVVSGIFEGLILKFQIELPV